VVRLRDLAAGEDGIQALVRLVRGQDEIDRRLGSLEGLQPSRQFVKQSGFVAHSEPFEPIARGWRNRLAFRSSLLTGRRSGVAEG
jgi:hypothetical protein